jgi:predicted nucleic acid-binding protein
MRSLAVVDSGPLIGALDRRDVSHARAVEALARRDLRLVVPALVIAEVAHFVEGRLGAKAEAAFLRTLAAFEIEAPTADEWPIIADMVERYADFPLGTTDASVAVLADRLDTDLIVTLDRRHFGAIRSPRGRAFRLLPELPAVHESAASYGAP